MDDAAFHAFYERTGSRLRGYLRRLTSDFELADDILQEACIRLLQSGRAGASDGERAAFLFRAATNLVYSGAGAGTEGHQRTGSAVPGAEDAGPADPASGAAAGGGPS